MCLQNIQSELLDVCNSFTTNIIKTIDKFITNRLNFADRIICDCFYSQEYYWSDCTRLLGIICKTTAVFDIKPISANGQCLNGHSLKMLIRRTLTACTPTTHSIEFRWIFVINIQCMQPNVLSCFTIHFDVVACSLLIQFAPITHYSHRSNDLFGINAPNKFTNSLFTAFRFAFRKYILLFENWWHTNYYLAILSQMECESA